MTRVSFLLLAALVACGGNKAKPTNLAPLPADQPVAEAPKPEPEKAPEPAPPAAPMPPLEVKVPSTTVAVKLVSPGKGKRAPLRYTATAGGKQQVEVAMDFSSKTTIDGETQEQTVPTVVLVGQAETKTVGADGKAEYALAISSTDAREVTGSQVPLDKFKIALASLSGLVIGGSIGPHGAAGDVTLRIEKPDDLSPGAIDLIRLTLPAWPVLPTEPVAVGAKWQATTSAKLADKLDVTQVTDYELVGRKGTTWTIKGKTKVSGKDQDIGGGKISNITGTGTSAITLADGSLYPTHTSTLETNFVASEGGKAMQFAIKVGGAVTTK
ncbi:MAG: hypothetical protein H0T89_09410 [Deltaproteobacteria bacterium]|nr:hypothetical protein [Deltaproteobacteria bacterium]